MSGNTEHRGSEDEIRCVQLLDASHRAGLEPMKFIYLHAFAYLAEALSPVWGIQASADEVLKREGLPFFPRLQAALDRLVWRGVVEVDDFRYVQDDRHKWILDATCHLSRDRSAGVLRRLGLFADERERSDLYLEIALGLAQSDNVTDLFLHDASYSDPSISVDRLIDLSSGNSTNLSARVADQFSALVNPEYGLASSERVGLYMAHLRRTAARGA